MSIPRMTFLIWARQLLGQVSAGKDVWPGAGIEYLVNVAHDHRCRNPRCQPSPRGRNTMLRFI